MKPVLLDANVLIALLWPAHEQHEAAHRWFGAMKARRWASCPLTELAFARIVSNPAFSTDALSPAAALSLLEENLKHPHHIFWPDDLPVRLSVFDKIGPVEGHKQLTDGYLLGLALAHNGMLATFDIVLKEMAARQLVGEIVELVPAN